MNLCKTCGTICPFDDEHEECEHYKPMTNEDWLRSCNTEQLAEWISDITCNCWGCKRIYVEDCPNYARYKACFCDKEDVVDWLKATTH